MAISPGDWITLLQADIARESTAAERYLHVPALARNARLAHQAAVCAAVALANVNLLAAEALALGARLPEFLRRTAPLAGGPAARDVEDPRRELHHYQRRLVWARRCGMPRLEELFWKIVWGKRNHLAHAAVFDMGKGDRYANRCSNR